MILLKFFQFFRTLQSLPQDSRYFLFRIKWIIECIFCNIFSMQYLQVWKWSAANVMTRDFAGSSLYHIHFSIRAWTWNFFEGLNSFSERFFNIICFARVLSSDSCCRFFDIINWINLRAYYLFCSLNTRMFSFFFFFVEFVLISRRSSLSNSAESGTSKFLREIYDTIYVFQPTKWMDYCWQINWQMDFHEENLLTRKYRYWKLSMTFNIDLITFLF